MLYTSTSKRELIGKHTRSAANKVALLHEAVTTAVVHQRCCGTSAADSVVTLHSACPDCHARSRLSSAVSALRTRPIREDTGDMCCPLCCFWYILLSCSRSTNIYFYHWTSLQRRHTKPSPTTRTHRAPRIPPASSRDVAMWVEISTRTSALSLPRVFSYWFVESWYGVSLKRGYFMFLYSTTKSLHIIGTEHHSSIHNSCDIEDLAVSHICKLSVILRSHLRSVYYYCCKYSSCLHVHRYTSLC